MWQLSRKQFLVLLSLVCSRVTGKVAGTFSPIQATTITTSKTERRKKNKQLNRLEENSKGLWKPKLTSARKMSQRLEAQEEADTTSPTTSSTKWARVEPLWAISLPPLATSQTLITRRWSHAIAVQRTAWTHATERTTGELATGAFITWLLMVWQEATFATSASSVKNLSLGLAETNKIIYI